MQSFPKIDHARLIIAMLTLYSFISGIYIKHTLYTHGTWSHECLPDLLKKGLIHVSKFFEFKDV